MFGIFTRKSGSKLLIGQYSPTPNLATLLILAMTEYIKQNEQVSGQLVPAINDARAAYDRLLRIGMDQTQNAQALKKQIQDNDQATNNREKAISLINFVKNAQEHFGPRTVLVSYTAFDDLCKRYGLSRGLLSDYCGVIPERNIQDIENVLAKIDSFPLLKYINNHHEHLQCDYIYVTGMDLDEEHSDLISFAEERHNILELVGRSYADYWVPKDIAGYNHGRYGYLSKIYGKRIHPSTLFIACPPKYLKNPTVKIQSKPVDPAVFQFTPFGVLVHTIWGEEAEDVAFKEFMDINLRIANS